MGDALVIAEMDWSHYGEVAARFGVETGRDANETVQYFFKAFVRNGLKDAAPFGAGMGYGESFGQQRRIGFNAVTRDVSRVFEPFEDLSLIKNLSNEKLKTRIHRYAIAGNVEKLKAVSRDLMPRLATENIVDAPKASDHKTQRDSRGRVRRGARRFFVARASKFNAYLRLEKSLVGLLKSGLGAAALRLGVSAPAWVLRGGLNGRCEVNLSINDPWISATNTIPYARAARADEAYARALGQTKTQMIAQLESKLRGEWGRSGGGKP